MKHRLRIEAATTFIEIYITLSGGSHKFSKNRQSFVNQSYHPGRWSLGANQLSGAKSGLNRFTRNRVLVTWEAFRAGHKQRRRRRLRKRHLKSEATLHQTLSQKKRKVFVLCSRTRPPQTDLKLGDFHVVVVQWKQKCTKKKYAARVELLFYSTNLMLFFAILVAAAVFVSTIKTWPNRKPRMKVSGTQGVTHPHPVHCK